MSRSVARLSVFNKDRMFNIMNEAVVFVKQNNRSL